VAVLVDSIALGATLAGLPRDIAVRAILEVFKATAEHLLKAGLHPAQLRDEVTTPAGVTVEGLRVLERRGVPAALIEVIERSARKAERLGFLIEEHLRSQIRDSNL